MNIRSLKPLRLVLLLTLAVFLVAVCGGLLAAADPDPSVGASIVASSDESKDPTPVTVSPDNENTLPLQEGEGSLRVPNEEESRSPDGSQSVPSDGSLSSEQSSNVPESGSAVPDTSGSSPADSSGDLSSSFPETEPSAPVTTTKAPVTTTKKPVVTDPPKYSTEAVTLTGALQSATAGPLSTDSGSPVTTDGTGNMPPQTNLTTDLGSSIAPHSTTTPKTQSGAKVTTAPAPSDGETQGDSARNEVLSTLITAFVIIAVLAVGALILTKVIRIR